MSGEWSASALGDALAETIFFAGVLLFVQSSVSSIKYLSRTHNASYELDPRSIELAKQGNPSEVYYVIKVTSAQHTAIHKAIGYHVTNPKLPWILENAIKYGGLM